MSISRPSASLGIVLWWGLTRGFSRRLEAAGWAYGVVVRDDVLAADDAERNRALAPATIQADLSEKEGIDARVVLSGSTESHADLTAVRIVRVCFMQHLAKDSL